MRIPSPFVDETFARAWWARWRRAALREFFMWAIFAGVAAALGADAYRRLHPPPWVSECLLAGSLMLFCRAALWGGFLAGAALQVAHPCAWSIRLLEFWLLGLLARGAVRAWLWCQPFLGPGASTAAAVRRPGGGPFAEPTGRVPADYDRATDEYVYRDGQRERAFLNAPYPRPDTDDGLDRSDENHDLDLH